MVKESVRLCKTCILTPPRKTQRNRLPGLAPLYLFLLSVFLHRRGCVCDRFLFLHHLGSHIPSSGVQVHAGYFCFHKPPKSDMGYRIFNVRTWYVVYVCIHMGGGHTNSESAHLSDSEKVFLVLPTGFKPLTFGALVQRSTN